MKHVDENGDDIHKNFSTMRFIDGKVKCAGCRGLYHLDMVYRCVYCKNYFCEGCAKKHFEKEEI